MYENYYNLKTMPFQITTDPRFLWLGEKHSEALATLKYGILENKGFLLLTGDVHSHAEFEEVERIAWTAREVRHIENCVTITPWGTGPVEEWGY